MSWGFKDFAISPGNKVLETERLRQRLLNLGCLLDAPIVLSLLPPPFLIRLLGGTPLLN